ncbi:MAG: hypothetical protein LBU32_20260 [Clostridiales bacterium]|jgi:hypothetical protein|nr:hypothetical protein [Clostridiales bacterium]
MPENMSASPVRVDLRLFFPFASNNGFMGILKRQMIFFRISQLFLGLAGLLAHSEVDVMHKIFLRSKMQAIVSDTHLQRLSGKSALGFLPLDSQ